MPSPLDKLLNRNSRTNVIGDDSIVNRGTSTTDSKMYFMNRATRGRLEIQFVPSDMSHERGGNWASADIIGRNDPKYQYVSGQTAFSMTLDFYADEESRTSVMRKVAWLQSLVANNGGGGAAPRVNLIMGEIFKDEIWIVKSVKAKYDNLSKPNGFLPQQAIVDIELCLDPDSNRGWRAIKRPYVHADSDGANPISLGQPDLGIPRKLTPNQTPSTRPYKGTREADDIEVGSGNNWRQIILRQMLRYRLPGGADNIKEQFL